MALDLGEQRIGVAVSDESETLASPLTVIRRESRAQLLAALESLTAQERVGKIVIGQTLTRSGEIDQQSRLREADARAIAERIALPVERWDEHLSTQSVERLLAGRRRKRGPPIDAVVAALLLQEYLDASPRRPTDDSAHE